MRPVGHKDRSIGQCVLYKYSVRVISVVVKMAVV